MAAALASACYVAPPGYESCTGAACEPPNPDGGDSCGDGTLDLARGETCDEGAANSLEPNATCRPTCQLAGCGDGVLDSGESCDDGNSLSGDRCSGTCEAETLGWQQLAPGVHPSARRDYAMAFDAVHQRVVLFGGYDSSVRRDDTWVFERGTWQQLATATMPLPRMGHAMAYDAQRGTVVLFGGELNNGGEMNDTWEFDGTTWQAVTLAASPATRQQHAMVYDAAREVVVLFGGTNGASETWEYDGVTWLQRTPTASPPGVVTHGMTYDDLRNLTVLYGGIGANDTWEYNGTTWTETALSSYGGSGWKSAMAFHRVSGHTVKHAGVNSSGTYRFDGQAWTTFAAPPGGVEPSGRYGHRLTYDEARGRLIMFGGQVYNGAMLDETWVFGYYDAAGLPEACDGTSDADGDGRYGCDDDDCWEACDPTCSPFLPTAACADDRPRCGDGTCTEPLESAALCPADCT